MDLIAICDRCRKPVEGSDGYIHVSYREIDRQRRERRHFERVARKRQVLSLVDLDEFPAQARWQVHHDRCDPNRAHGCYWFGVERCRTWPQLIEWTAHLMQKDWFCETDWEQVLSDAVHGGKRRLVCDPPPVEVEDA